MSNSDYCSSISDNSEKLNLLRLHLRERGFFHLRFRGILLGLAILVLVSGLLLFAITTVRETHTSTDTSTFTDAAPRGGFEYYGWTGSYSSPTQIIVGTSGIADLMLLTTPWRDFNSWVCHHMLAPGYTLNCAGFGGGNYFNLTILYSYLQTNQSQIAYSQTIVDQNLTLTSLSYHVTNWSDVTAILAHIGSGISRDFYQTTVTHQTISYPLLGYTEMPGTIFTLPSISIGLMVASSASLVILSMTQLRLHPSSRSVQYKGSAAQKCPGCGGENLFFTERCRHCGRILHETPPMMKAR